MSVSTVYSELVSNGITPDGVVIEPTAKDKADNSSAPKFSGAVLNWHSSAITREFFQSLYAESEKLVDEAIVFAINYPTTNNHAIVIQKLTRAAQIRSIIKEHAKQRSS